MEISMHQVFLLFFQSIGVFMAIYFFIQYWIVKRKDHLYYAIYMVVLVLYCFLAMPEYFFREAASDPEVLARLDLFKRPVQYLTSIFYTYFVIYYLGLEKIQNSLTRLLRALLVVYFLASGLCLLGNVLGVDYGWPYFIVSLLVLPVQVYVLISLFKSRVPYAGFIIWGSLITIAGSLSALLLSLYNLGLSPADKLQGFQIFLPAQIAILIDMFLYSIALQKKTADAEKSYLNMVYQKQQAVLLERERIIADLHDDVGGGLSSIRMMSDLMAGQVKSNPDQARFAEKISLTAKDIAQRMHTIIWSLNQENDRLGNFLEYVRQYGIAFFEGSPVRFHFEAPGADQHAIILSGGLRKNLFMVVKEALHNAWKHAGASDVWVMVEANSVQVRITVKDNGGGMHEENKRQGSGNGLRNMRKRIVELGGQMHINDANGTELRFTAPIT